VTYARDGECVLFLELLQAAALQLNRPRVFVRFVLWAWATQLSIYTSSSSVSSSPSPLYTAQQPSVIAHAATPLCTNLSVVHVCLGQLCKDGRVLAVRGDLPLQHGVVYLELIDGAPLPLDHSLRLPTQAKPSLNPTVWAAEQRVLKDGREV
jgi:hypothetical protein